MRTSSNRERLNLPAWTAIIVGILLANISALIWSRGIFNLEAFGYAVAGALLPGAIAYGIAGREKDRNLNRFAAWFLAVSVVLVVLARSALRR